MTKSDIDPQRISQINTHWSEILDAHNEQIGGLQVAEAQKNVIKRYSGCIYRYLLGATRNADIADDLVQEFAFHFVRGDFRNAHPSKGRFRDYLKTALRNLVIDHFRQQKKNASVSLEGHQHLVESEPAEKQEEDFNELWRQALITHAWKALEELEERKSNSYFLVLRFRADHPDLSSTEMAKAISETKGQTVTSDWVRQKLHRARQKFSRFLLEEVRKTTNDLGPQELDAELAELRLLKYFDT